MANEIQPIAEIPEQQIPQEEIITETEVSEPIVAPEPPNKSILKSKDGRLFSFKQLIDNNYTPERIQSGIDKQSLTVVGDITDNDQQYKSSDGRMFTYKDLVGAGYDADRIDNGIANGKLSIVEKKSPSPSSLMPTNGSQAGVSPSTTTIQETAVEVGGPGPEPEPNLVDWLASKRLPYDKQSRQKLAELYKIQGYDFSEAKNKELLDYAKTDYELGGNVKQLNYTNDDQGLTKYAQDNGLQYDGSLQSKKQLLADAKTKVGSTKDIQDLVSYAMTFGNLDVSDFSSPESKQKLTDVLGKEAQSLGIQNFNIQDPKSLADLAEGVRTKTNKIEGLYENMQYIKPVSVPTSITEVVETIGLPSDMQSRAKLAVQKGVVQNEAEYVGNGIQNTKLINALKPQYFKIKFAKNLQDVANTVGVKNFDPSNMGSLNDLSSKINQKVGGIKEQYAIFNKEKGDYEKNGRPMGWDFDTYIKFKYNKNKFSQPNLERGYEYRPTKNGVVKFKISEEEQKKYDTMPYLGAMNPTQQKENAKQMGVPLSTYQGIQLAALKGDYTAFADLPQFQKYLKPSRSVMIKSTEFTDEGKKEINSFISDPGNYLRIQKEKGLVNEAEIKNQADEYNRKFKGAVFAQMLSTLPPGEAESSGFAGISKILNPETAQNFAEYLWNNAWAGATQVAGGLYGVIGEDLPSAILDIFTDHKTDRSVSNFLKNDLRESLTFNLRGYDKVFANDYILSAAGAVANMLPAALVNPSGVPLGFVALGYAGGMDAINSTPEGQKLPEYQKMVFAYSNGIMQGVIAKMGIDKIFGSASNKLAINTTLNTIKKAEANNIVLTPLTFEKLATAELNSIKTKALSLAGHMGTGATFGLAMSANDKLLKKLMNESLGKDVFELPSMKLPTKFNDIFNAKAYGEGWGEMLAEVRQGALMGGIGASIPMLFSKKQSELKTKIMQADTPEALNKLREQINDKALGNITLDQRETLNKIIDEYSTYNSKIPLSIINIPTRVRIADNLKRRDGLVDELNELMKKKETEDPAFQEGLNEQINGVQRLIEDINKEISDIYSGKKKEPVIVTQETQDLVQATDLPTEMTPEVVKVAEDNGITVDENTTPQDVVNEVKNKIGDSTPIVLESVDSKIKNFESTIADAQRRLKENPEDTQATQDLAQAQIELDQIKRDPVRYFEAQKERTINDLQDQLEAGADPQMLQIEAVAKNFDELIEDAKKYAKENPIGDEAVVEVKTEAKKGTGAIEEIEYNEFIDKGIVSKERLDNIAEKVKNREELSDRERQIFADKTAEINKIIAEKAKAETEVKTETTNQKEIDRLRAEEQAELDSRIPNAEQYRVDGKVDRSKLTNPEDIKAFDEVYAKYDKLISPLLEKAEPTKTEAKPEAPTASVEETAKGIENVGENTAEKNMLATRAGLIVHAGDSKIDKLDTSKAKGGVRAIYGKGIYFTDSPYKAADYGGEFTYLDKSKLSIIDTDQPISQDFINSIKDASKKAQQDGQSVKSALYDMFARKLQDEINGERDIDMAWKSVRDKMRADQSDNWNSLLKDLGYDTIKNGYEYVIFDAEKGNTALVNDGNSHINNAYHEALKVPEQKRTKEQNRLISSVNETLGISEAKPEAPTAKPEEVTPTEAKSSLEQAKEAMRAAKEKLDAMRRNIGVMKDPKKEAQALYDYHKSLVGVAKEYIKAGIKTVEDFAKAIGEKVTTELKDAWNEATGKKELAEAKPEVGSVGVGEIKQKEYVRDEKGNYYPINTDLPKGFTITQNYENYEGQGVLYDQYGYRIMEGNIKEIEQELKDSYPIGTSAIKDGTNLDLYSNINNFTLKQFETILQNLDPQGEWDTMVKEVDRKPNEYEAKKLETELLAESRGKLKEFVTDMLKSDKADEYIGFDIPKDGLGKTELPQQKGVGETKPEAPIAEAPKTALEQAKEAMRAAKEKLNAIRKNLGIIKDPKKEAQALYDYHKALVGVAKEYVKLGVKTVEDWAKQIGENVDAALTYAWNEATGKVKESEQYEDVPYIKASYEKSRLESERAGAEGGGGEPPIVTSNPDLYSPNGGKRKAALKRNVMEAEGIPSSLKDKIADNLNYEVSSNLEAEQVAKALVDQLGDQDARVVAGDKDMHPSVRSAIFAELINRAAERERNATTTEAKMEAAEQWADLVNDYSAELTGAGQFTSYAGHFYRTSPLGFLLRENQLTNERFNEWAKDKNVDEIYDALMQMEGGPEKIGAEVEKLRKEERKADRAKRDKKIDDFFDSMKLKGGTYAVVIPPDVWNRAVDLMKAAVKGGDRVVDAVKQATEYISSQIGDNWDKEKFKNDYERALSRVADEGKKERTEEDVIRGYEAKMKELQRRIDEGDFSAEEYKEKKTLSDKEQVAKEEYEKVKAQYDEAKKKSPEYQKKKAEQFLNEFQRRAKGIDKEKLKEIVRRSVLKISESGGLQREEFRKIVADVMGFKDLTNDQVSKIEKLTDIINAVGPLEDAMVNNPTKENIEKLRQARKEAAVAEVELINMVHRKADFKNTFASIWKGSLMSLFTLLKNPIQNETFQAGVRLPVAFVKQAVEAGLFGVTKGLRGIGIKVPEYTPTTNLAIAQKYYFLGKKEGAKRGLLKFRSGHQGGDYFGTTSYQSSLSPRQAKIDWKLWKSGEKFMTTKEAIDTWIRKSWPSRQADLILRSLGFGDMPARVAAQWGRGAQIAWQELGLREDAQIQAFIESPKKYAYKVLREGGMDEAKAAAKAEEMQNRIMEEGSRAVMEQENILTQAIAGIKGGEKIRESLPASILATTTFPFLKIYSNVMWTGFKLAFPDVSMAQSAYYAREAYLSNKKGDVKKAKEYIEKSKDAASYAAVGAGFRYIAAPYLQQNNLVRSSMSSDEKRRAMQGERFYGKMNQINLGKMLGGDDFFVDLSYWGPLGATMDMATKENERELQKGLKGEERGSWIAERVEDIQEEGLELLNVLALNNGAQTLNAFTSTDKGTAYGISLMNGLGNVMTGGTYAAISKAMLPYEVDNKADKFFNEALNNQKSRNILLRMYAGMPPSRVSIWGEPIKRDVSATGVIYSLLGFEKGSDDKFGAILFNDYQRTQNDKFFPTPIKDKLEVNGREVELPKEKLSELQTFVGQDRKLLIGSLLYDQTKLQVSEIGFKEDVKNNPKYKNVDAGKYLNTIKQKLADYATKYGVSKFDWTRYSSQDELLAKANPIDKKEIQALLEDKSAFTVKKVAKTYSEMNDEQRANACELIYDFGLKTGMKKFQELNPEYRTMTPSGLDRKIKAYKENVNEINRRVFNKKIKQADALNEAELQSLTNYVEMPQSQQKVTQDANVEATEMPETSPEVILFPMENISMDEGDE